MAFKSVLDRSFTYRNAASTDVRITFERIRREMKEQQRGEAEALPVVRVLEEASRRLHKPRLRS